MLLFGNPSYGPGIDVTGLRYTEIRYVEASGPFMPTKYTPAGDVDGDGLSDFLLGHGGTDWNGVNNTGQAMVVFGRRDFPTVAELSDLAGLRNVLVHIYGELNLDEIHSVLQNDLKILRSFRDEIKELFKKG